MENLATIVQCPLGNHYLLNKKAAQGPLFFALKFYFLAKAGATTNSLLPGV